MLASSKLAQYIKPKSNYGVRQSFKRCMSTQASYAHLKIRLDFLGLQDHHHTFLALDPSLTHFLPSFPVLVALSMVVLLS